MTRIASETRTYRPACQRFSSSLRTRLKWRISTPASLPCSGFRLRARYVVVIFVGPRHPAQHFLGLIGLRSRRRR